MTVVSSATSSTRLAFWNVHGDAKAAPNHKGDVVGVVDALFDSGASIVGLSEVHDYHVLEITRLPRRNIGVLEPPQRTRTGRANWGLAVAYRTELWTQAERAHPIEAWHGNDNLKIACRFVLEPTQGGMPLKLYVAHWPSRLHGSGGDKRKRAAVHLWKQLAQPLASYERVVVMGDFNDEPFGTLEEDLNAVRDLAAVRKCPDQFLFNPFWRVLGHESFDRPALGTYRSARFPRASWWTFDQILLSHELVKNPNSLSKAGTISDVFGSPEMPNWSDHIPVFVDVVLF